MYQVKFRELRLGSAWRETEVCTIDGGTQGQGAKLSSRKR
jgi:hypothetical protein